MKKNICAVIIVPIVIIVFFVLLNQVNTLVEANNKSNAIDKNKQYAEEFYSQLQTEIEDYDSDIIIQRKEDKYDSEGAYSSSEFMVMLTENNYITINIHFMYADSSMGEGAGYNVDYICSSKEEFFDTELFSNIANMVALKLLTKEYCDEFLTSARTNQSAGVYDEWIGNDEEEVIVYKEEKETRTLSLIGECSAGDK
ncbi:MAG: hypothetical protein ACI4DS_06495 [Eubacterium sp.]